MEPNSSHSSAVGICDLCLERQSLIYTSWNPRAGILIERKLCASCCKRFSIKTDELTTKAINAAHSHYLEWEQQERVRQRMSQRQLKLSV